VLLNLAKGHNAKTIIDHKVFPVGEENN